MKAIINHLYKVVDIIDDGTGDDKIDIPADVQRIKPGVFARCPNLRTIRISILTTQIDNCAHQITELFKDNTGIAQVTDVIINISPAVVEKFWDYVFPINDGLLGAIVTVFPNVHGIQVVNSSKRSYRLYIDVTADTVAYYQRIAITLHGAYRFDIHIPDLAGITPLLNAQDLLVSIYETPISASYRNTHDFFGERAQAEQALKNLLLIPMYADALLQSMYEEWCKSNTGWLKSHYKGIFLDAIELLDSMDGFIVRAFERYQTFSVPNASTYEQYIDAARKYDRTILLSYLLDEYNRRFDAKAISARKEKRAIREVMDPCSVSAMRRTLRFSMTPNKEEVCIIGLKNNMQHDNLVIPSHIADSPVTTLREKCFAADDIGAVDLSQCSQMQHIPSECFNHCGLSLITLPPNLLDIEELAMAHCSSLQRCILPDGLQSIGNFAFQGSGLNYVTTPASLRVIGRCAYSYTTTCTAAHITGAPYMDHSVFQGSAVQYCQLDGVTAITNRTFADCTSLATVIAPKAQAIDHEGFVNCASLETIVLSGDIIYVAHDAFGGALHIKRILLVGGGENAATEKAALFPPHLRSIVRAYDPVSDSVYLRNI